VLTAAQVNTYLNEQTVMVFADSAARTTALSGVLAEGMVSYLQDTNAVEVYNGTAWVGVSGAGDVTEVQAGVGISVASGTGPIPVITNSSTDLITTAGDLLYGTAADTVARLGIGTVGQVLQVNSGATAPEWAAAASGGGYTELATGSLSGATTRIQSISADYRELVLIIKGFRPTNTTPLGRMYLRVNNDSGNNYWIMTAAGSSTAGSVSFYALGNINYPQICDTMDRTDYTESILVATFPDYARTDTDHLYRADVKYTYSADSAGFLTQGLIAYVPSAPAAINEIDIFTSEGTWDSGSYILYGVK
jgi:hypothetical protein